MDAVAGARRTPGFLKLEAFHQSRQPHSLCLPQCSWTSVHSTRGDAASVLTRCRGSRIVRPCRCGDFGFVSRHKPASRTSRSDVSATPDGEASRITSCRGRRALCTERRCGIVVSLQSRRRRWDSLVGFVVFDFRWRNSRGGNAYLEALSRWQHHLCVAEATSIRSS